MITRFSDARESYLELFEKATKRLESFGFSNASGVPYGKDAKVETLEEYFTNLRNLVYGPDDYIEDESGYEFLKLPLNEPHFEIEANSRTITVPPLFQKNGISVAGDEVAEILFFEVDRFYDATDLYDTKIIIQWQAPGNSTGVQYTPAFAKTTFIHPSNGDEKVVFGWPITSTITKQAGVLTFSVRFYIENAANPTQELPDFSLSTLTQKVTINPSLTVDILGLAQDDRLDAVLNRRTKNSPPVGEPQDPAEPVWIFYSPNDDIAENDNTDIIIDYQIPSTGLDLALLGYKIDSGSLSYCWKRDGEALTDGFLSPIEEKSGTFVPVTKFIENTDGTMQIAAYYYESYTKDFVKTQPITSQEQFQQASIDHGTLYVRCSKYTLTPGNVTPGIYYAEIKNTLYTKEALDNPLTRIKWIVEETPAPVITSTTWSNDMTDTSKIAEYIIDRGNTSFVLEVLEGENLTDATTYHWEKSANQIITSTPGDYTVINDSKICTPTEEGYYRVQVNNTRNNSTKTTTVGPILLLHKIADIRPHVKQTVTEVDDTTSTLAVSISADRGAQKFEEISYSWHCMVDGNQIAIDGATDPSYNVPTEETTSGKYSVKIFIKKGNQTSTEFFVFQ